MLQEAKKVSQTSPLNLYSTPETRHKFQIQPAEKSALEHRTPYHIGAALLTIDALSMVLACLLAIVVNSWLADYIIAYQPLTAEGMETRAIFFGFMAAILFGGFYAKGHYRRRMPWWSQVGHITKFSLILLTIDLATHFIFNLPAFPITILVSWTAAFALLITLRRFGYWAFKGAKSWALETIVIAENDTIADTIFAFNSDPLTGYHIKRVIPMKPDDAPLDMSLLPQPNGPIYVEKKVESIPKYIRQNPNFFYVISIEGFRGQRRDALMNALHAGNIPHAILPPARRVHLYGMEAQNFFGNDIMLLHDRSVRGNMFSQVIKRGMDIAASCMVLPILGLLTLILMVGKKLEGSKTPLFYGGVRVGKDGERFKCWKFCTMREDADKILDELLASDPEAKAEWDTFEKLKNDPRVDSKVSALLRKTSLDELPQIWSIFVGDMSLVGPRPILESQIETYGKEMRAYKVMRPGLTGLWQVSGRNETSFQRRIHWDVWYIRNWTLWHDMVILFKTVKVFLTGGGAY